MNHMTNYIIELGAWSWLIFGALLLAIEVLAPGTYMLWVGVAALITGAAAITFDLGLQAQLIVFVAAALLSVLVGRKLMMGRSDETDQPFLNERQDQLIGKTFTVTTAIKNGRGKVKVGDTVWPVNGPDCETGSQVRVIAVDGNRLTVEQA